MTSNINNVFNNEDIWNSLQGFLTRKENYQLGITCKKFAKETPIARLRLKKPTTQSDKISQLWAKFAFPKYPSLDFIFYPPPLPIRREKSNEIPVLGTNGLTAVPITPIASRLGITIFRTHGNRESYTEVLLLAAELREKKATLQALPICHETAIQIRALKDHIHQLTTHLGKVSKYVYFMYSVKWMNTIILELLHLPNSSLILAEFGLFTNNRTSQLIYDVLSKKLTYKSGSSNSQELVIATDISYEKSKKFIPIVNRLSFEKLKKLIRKKVHFYLPSAPIIFSDYRYTIYRNGTIYNQQKHTSYQINQAIIRNYFPCENLTPNVSENTLILSRGDGIDVIDLVSGELISSLILPALLGKKWEIINLKIDMVKNEIHIAAQTDQFAHKFIYSLNERTLLETLSQGIKFCLIQDHHYKVLRWIIPILFFSGLVYFIIRQLQFVNYSQES